MAVAIHRVDSNDRTQVRRFVELPYRLYAGHPHWVPPLRVDARLYLDRRRHPFYEHSEADFFLAVREGRDVGRVAALVNRRYNSYRRTSRAQFYLFDCEDDPEAAGALFERVFEWARERGGDAVFGPKGFSVLDGFGVLIHGFEHRQTMNLLNYNYDYYPRLVEAAGFRKEVDFVSSRLQVHSFALPDWIRELGRRVRLKGELKASAFATMTELLRSAREIVETYDRAFVDNWEYWPQSDREMEFIIRSLKAILIPDLITVIRNGERLAGFLIALPDVSNALRRCGGRLLPLGFVDLWREKRSTRSAVFYGVGLLPEVRGQGANALLFTQLENTVRRRNIQSAEVAMIADTAVEMRLDMESMGIKPDKTHRVYSRSI